MADQLLEVGATICPGDLPHASSERLGLSAVPFPYKMTTICFVGPSAYVPVHSALTLFPEEFAAVGEPPGRTTHHPGAGGGGGAGMSDAPDAAESTETTPDPDVAVLDDTDVQTDVISNTLNSCQQQATYC